MRCHSLSLSLIWCLLRSLNQSMWTRPLNVRLMQFDGKPGDQKIIQRLIHKRILQSSSFIHLCECQIESSRCYLARPFCSDVSPRDNLTQVAGIHLTHLQFISSFRLVFMSIVKLESRESRQKLRNHSHNVQLKISALCICFPHEKLLMNQTILHSVLSKSQIKT